MDALTTLVCYGQKRRSFKWWLKTMIYWEAQNSTLVEKVVIAKDHSFFLLSAFVLSKFYYCLDFPMKISFMRYPKSNCMTIIQNHVRWAFKLLSLINLVRFVLFLMKVNCNRVEKVKNNIKAITAHLSTKQTRHIL